MYIQSIQQTVVESECATKIYNQRIENLHSIERDKRLRPQFPLEKMQQKPIIKS